MATEILYSVFKYNCKMHNKTCNPVQAIEILEVEKRKMQKCNIEEFNEFISYLSKYEHVFSFIILFFIVG